MTHGFLDALASYYFQTIRTDSSNYCFVFPSQRSSLFFLNHLQSKVDTPQWAPKTSTVNDLFASLSNLVVADSITLLFTLHRVYNQVTLKDISFDEFLPWGEMFLNDFDDLEKYLIPVDQLYSNLASLKELEDDFSHLSDEQIEAIQSFWGAFDPKKLSKHQTEFLSIWKLLPAIYQQFKEALLKEGWAFEGMIYRQVAEDIKQNTFSINNDITYIFVGLNALTPVERTFMTYLQKLNKAVFFWDYSPWILPEKSTEEQSYDKSRGPGLFIRDNLSRFPSPKDFTLPLTEEGPEITITAVANPTEQLKVMHRFLNSEYEPNLKTAVVLADETLLMPVLHGIPENVDRINITMGYPLNLTPVFGLVDLLFDMQRQARQNSKNDVWLYHRHVIPILQHQYISMLAETEARQIKNSLIAKNQVFVNADSLHVNELFTLVFSKVQNANGLADYLQNILAKVFDLLKQKENRIIEQEFVYTLFKSINKLQDSLEFNKASNIELETWIKLYRKLADFETVAFKGQPLAGLQIMGILETRALDFDKLVILDLNEGIFPKSAPPNTFIPANLRMGFGMPTIEFQDTIFSYYFFRLIHRAKKVQITHSTGESGMKSNEMSRYLHQLKYQFKANIKFETSSGEVTLQPYPSTIAHKTADVMKRLSYYQSENGGMLSPSALSVYIECQLKFYYQKIAKLQETDEIAEEADARIFGLLFHDVVEQLYKPHSGQIIEKETIQKWLNSPKLIEQHILDAFNKYLSDYDKGRSTHAYLHGKNVMVYEVIKQYINQFLKLEQAKTPFKIIALEKNVKWQYTTPEGINICMGGIIDRLEEKDSILKVMDYKTGKGEAQIKEVAELFNTTSHKKNKAIFQTLLYSLVLDATQAHEAKSVQPHIIWVRDLFKKDYDTTLYLKEEKNGLTPISLKTVKTEFTNELNTLLAQLFNAELPFMATEQLDKCKFCTYKNLCNRQ